MMAMRHSSGCETLINISLFMQINPGEIDRYRRSAAKNVSVDGKFVR
jgi:hypothetical protein